MNSSSRCSLNPAPGPLSWLFPEMVAFEPGQIGSLVDLTRRPYTAAELQEHLGSYAEVAVADGPRGRSLCRILKAAFRAGGPRVRLDDSIPQLESSLVELAAAAPAGEVMLDTGEWRAVTELEADQVGLLPLRPLQAFEDIDVVKRAWSTGCRGRVVPVFLTDPSPAEQAYTRLPEPWWGLLPGDHYPDDLRAAHHDLLRTLWPDRFLQFRAFESYALAGFDLYDEVSRGRFDMAWKRPPSVSSRRPLVLGIDGIDGAGKTSQLKALRRYLESLGLVVGVHKIYRHGVFHETVTELTRQCAGDRNLHLWPLQRRVKLFDSIKYYYSSVVPDLQRCDVLLFDRYVQTHRAAGLGRYDHDPFAREFVSVYPEADRVYLLDLPEPTALARIAKREKSTVDENSYMLGRYRAALLEMASDPNRSDGCLVRLDGTASIADNQAKIRADVDCLLKERV
ncbi:MAG: hypothetical protein VX951_12725 [Planctomycetota bacterium]|nr:hypothetical protein [Planctomycetota bacterium]